MIAKLASATALALILGASAAAAQSGGDARNNDRKIEKALDDQALTPVRPIRRVGPNDWPAANNATTGQSTEDSAKQDAAKPNAAAQNPPANQPKPEAAKQEASKQEAPKQDAVKRDAAKQETAKQDAAKQDSAKQEAAKQEAAKQEAAKQEAAKSDTRKQAGDNGPVPNNATNNSTASAPAPQDKKDTAQGSANPQQNSAQQKDQQSDHGFASIRLGTDAQGRVAVNDEQERQIAAALRKQRVQPVESSGISVKVGAVAPAGVRLGAVSSDFVAVLPQFRGYSLFASRDEIAIVEPGTRKIVALVPVKLTATASAPPPERSTERSASAPPQERSSERSATTRSTRRSNSERDVTVGAGVPSEEEILRAPTTRSRSYRTVQPSDTVIIERRRRPAWLFGFGRF